jgi:hypothetical protein
LPGSIKEKGKMEGEALVFEWTNKKGTQNTMTLKKHEESKLKVRLDKSGPMGSKERPLNEAIFKRK